MSMKNSVIEGNATDCLPLEIWALIFGHAARKTSTGDDALVVSYYRDVKTLVSIMCVCRAWQDIGRAELFSVIHLSSSMGIPRLLRHLVDQDAQNLHPAASTRALDVFGWNQTDPKQLTSLVRFMPNLRVFSCKYLAITVPCLVELQKRSRLILREFEATVYDDMRAVLSHIGQFEALQTLRLWVGVGIRPSGQALPIMRLGSLRSLLICTAPGDLFGVAQWLARCEFGGLQKFFYVSPTCMPGSTDARVPADLSPMASFFAAQRSMHTLAFDTSGTYEAIVGLLSQRLPPALDLVDFGFSMIPAELPPFPRSIQRLSFQTDPDNLGDLWSTFDTLLNQKSRLPPGLRIAFHGSSQRPELARFRWRDFLRAGAISTDMLSEAATDRNKMVLYAKQFERIGVSIIDEDDCVWTPQGSSDVTATSDLG